MRPKPLPNYLNQNCNGCVICLGEQSAALLPWNESRLSVGNSGTLNGCMGWVGGREMHGVGGEGVGWEMRQDLQTLQLLQIPEHFHLAASADSLFLKFPTLSRFKISAIFCRFCWISIVCRSADVQICKSKICRSCSFCRIQKFAQIPQKEGGLWGQPDPQAGNTICDDC